ncbi:PREDICTED: uncharacterized protein LOC107170631 isoform X2 [Diuraphis noxia]|uniref:uncharacterized protein LOC107170631 isoform X2 n=1 Tax=Diuraphis noxia TaxID=143948 RepID=UPI000763948C|nr:PREDICTED: uncharacterized protein LOC107170631 isoform X2 [Diuraphis noxia]
MADMNPKRSSDGVEHWKSINFYWSLVMYITRNVLRIFFSIAACIMFQISSWLKILSDYLKTTEKAEDLPEKTIENRCNVNSSSNHTNKNEELKAVFKVINDTDNELIDKECNLYSNHISKNEEQKEANKVIGMNGLIDNGIKNHENQNEEDYCIKVVMSDTENKLLNQEYNYQSVLDHNIVTEQQIVNGAFTNIVNYKLSEESDSQYYENEQKIITCEDIGSARVRKKHPIKNTAMLLITKTMNENKLKDKQFKLENKLNKDKIAKNNIDHCEMDDGRNPITKTQMITKQNDVHWKDFEDFDNSKPNSKTEHVSSKFSINRKLLLRTPSNNSECRDNHDGTENRKPFSKTENMTTKEPASEGWKDNDNHEFKKPITKIENNMLNIYEVEDDIFDLPSKFSLAHCICEDFHNSMGMTADFKFKFGKIGALMDQHLRVSDVGHIIHNEQHVFYLVIKKKVVQKPLLSSLEIALYNLRSKMNGLKLTKLAIPKYGLDTFDMTEVKKLISKIFKLSNIEVTLCLASPKLDIQQFNPPKVNFTYKQLWEMEKQTDLILFIDINTVYSENWNDIVFEHINAKFPFKEKLLEDINVKPMTHGDLLIYKVDSEVLFCLFLKPYDQNPMYFRSLEKAFQEMKSQLTGYRYLGIQQEPISYKPSQHILPRILCVLKSVFSVQNAEIWVCGDTEQHKTYNYQQYKKVVNDVIDLNQKRNSKPSNKSRHRLEKKKHSANSNNSKHDLSEKYCSKNTSDVNVVTYLNREPIPVDNYITENWDN